MRKCIQGAIAGIGVAFASVSLADTVVIDFEGLDTGGASFSSPLIEDGFVIDPALAPSGPVIVAVAGGNGTNSIIFCGWCVDGSQGVSIYSESGATFGLDSLDVFSGYGFGPEDFAGAGLVTGYLDGGGSVSQSITATVGSETVTFGSGWSNLTSIDIVFATSSSNPYAVVPSVDNITLQAVPVPAAVWLFGSALAGLVGFKRRRAS